MQGYWASLVSPSLLFTPDRSARHGVSQPESCRQACPLCCLLVDADGRRLGADPSLSSYEEALAAFQAERAAGKGPRVSSEDRAVIEQGPADLAEAMPSPGLRGGEGPRGFALPMPRGESMSLRCSRR